MPTMPAISDAEMASIQADVVAAACDLSCQIERASIAYSPGPSGTATSSVTTWPVISPPGLLAAMTEPTAGQLQNYEYMIGDQAAWHIRFPVGTDVVERDRLLITDKTGYIRTLSVSKVLKPRSYAVLLSVLAIE
jgi:hypothetical protein